MGPRRHHQRPTTRRHHRNSSPATVAETNTPTSSEHSAKRHSIGPTTLASTCQPRGDTPEPANEPDSDSTCNRGRRGDSIRSPAIRDQEVAGLPDRPEAGEWRKPGLTDRLRRTKSARVVPRVPSIQPESGGRPDPRDDAGGCNADGLSSDVRYHQPANRQARRATTPHRAQALGTGQSAARDNAESGRGEVLAKASVRAAAVLLDCAIEPAFSDACRGRCPCDSRAALLRSAPPGPGATAPVAGGLCVCCWL